MIAINRSDDRKRRGTPPEEFLQDYVDTQHTFKSLTIIDQILMSMDEKDRRRPLLYQLRRQLQEDEITFEEARHAIIEMESALEKVTAPANRVGTLLEIPDRGLAYVNVGGSEYYANLDPRLDESDLKVGSLVLLNDAFAVVGELGYPTSGPVTKVVDVLDDGRVRVGQEHGSQASVLNRSTDLEDASLKAGEEVRVDPNYRVALERMPNRDEQDYYLEEVPELPWEMIGGQAEAIRAIKDTIEMPVLHPELRRGAGHRGCCQGEDECQTCALGPRDRIHPGTRGHRGRGR